MELDQSEYACLMCQNGYLDTLPKNVWLDRFLCYGIWCIISRLHYMNALYMGKKYVWVNKIRNFLTVTISFLMVHITDANSPETNRPVGINRLGKHNEIWSLIARNTRYILDSLRLMETIMEIVAVQIPLRKRKLNRPGRATMHIRLTPIYPSISTVIPVGRMNMVGI